MERRGILIDTDMCRRQWAVGEARMATIQRELGGLCPGSPKDVAILILDKAGLPLLPDHKRSGKTGKLSWDKTVMAEYEEIIDARGDLNNVANDILEYRGWSKTVSSNYKPYLNKLSPDGRLRSHFKIHGTKNVRLSSEDPNLQNIPRETTKPWNGKLKQAFKAKPGYKLVGRDYSQLEYRLGAAYAQQDNVLRIFNDSSRDIFDEMAVAVFGDILYRQGVKTITYAKTYGAGMAKIALLLGGDTDEAMKFIKRWEAQHSLMNHMSQVVNARARNRGYIKMWTGRRRHFPFKSEARKGWNSLIQGGGAEIVKSAMIRCHEYFRGNEECQMVLQVHDEILFEIKEDMVDHYDRVIKGLMEDVESEFDFGVHFKTESKVWGS